MNTRTHNYKKQMARRMMTQAEIKSHTPIFASRAWVARGDAIRHRLIMKKLAKGLVRK